MWLTAIRVIVGRLRLRADGSNRRAGAKPQAASGKPQAAKKEAKCYSIRFRAVAQLIH